MPGRPLPAVERLEPIGLEAVDAIAAPRRRFDSKYLMPRGAIDALLRRLESTHRVLEVHSLRDFEYLTTYFDTEELRAFRDHVQGRRRRLKVRVRHYVETGDCFFELKLRGPRGCTIKHRLPHNPTLRRSLTVDSLAALEEWVWDAYRRPAPSRLTPALEVLYRRATLVAPDRGERLTVDVDLRMRAARGDGWGRLDPELAVVESKSPRGLALATRELKALGARPLETMSKYCVGVVLAHRPAPGNALLPVLRHCAGGRGARPAPAHRPAV